MKLKTLDRKTALIVVDLQIGFDDATWGERNDPGADCPICCRYVRWQTDKNKTG